MSIIFHLDLDSFFVSVERILDPSLNGKPVIVGGNPKYGKGVVAACSYEAREYGLHSAMPIKHAYRLCPNGIYIRGHHNKYSYYSKEVKLILEKYAPMLEQASIDEFYMDFTGCKHIYGPPFIFAQKIQHEILEKLQLPCSIGIGGNKTIAKIASDFMKPQGVTYVLPGMEKEFLAPMPVQAMPGIGKKTLKVLNSRGFYKLGDITKESVDYFADKFGKHGIAIWYRANGEGKEYLSLGHQRKGISHERTFWQKELNKDEVERKLFKLTGMVCQSLRNKNWKAGTIIIKLRYSDFVTITRSKTIKPTDDDKIIFSIAVEMLRKAYTRNVPARLVGIRLTKFSLFCEQQKLFVEKEDVRSDMFRAVNNIRNRFGYDTINVGIW